MERNKNFLLYIELDIFLVINLLSNKKRKVRVHYSIHFHKEKTIVRDKHRSLKKSVLDTLTRDKVRLLDCKTKTLKNSTTLFKKMQDININTYVIIMDVMAVMYESHNQETIN